MEAIAPVKVHLEGNCAMGSVTNALSTCKSTGSGITLVNGEYADNTSSEVHFAVKRVRTWSKRMKTVLLANCKALKFKTLKGRVLIKRINRCALFIEKRYFKHKRRKITKTKRKKLVRARLKSLRNKEINSQSKKYNVDGEEIKHLYVSNSESDDDTPENSCSLPDEDIRNQLRLQLDLLRNQKKSKKESASESNVPSAQSANNPTNPKATSENSSKADGLTNIESTLADKEKATNEKTSSALQADKVESETENAIVSSVEDQPSGGFAEVVPAQINPPLSDVLLSNEGEHLIVSVVGGVVLDSDDDPDDEPNNNDENLDAQQLKEPIETEDEVNNVIVPKKTSDVTKIKGWRTKKFAVNLDLEKVESKNTVIALPYEPLFKNKETSDPIPCCSKSLEAVSEESPLLENKEADKSLCPQEASPKSEKKSAFVSDALDSFLTNHSKLKISYEIPKLFAEEGINTKKHEEDINIPIVPPPESVAVKKPINKLRNQPFKPKTVAEMRRMLEQDRERDIMYKMETRESDYCNKLEQFDGRKNKAAYAEVVKSCVENEQEPITRGFWSYINNMSKLPHQYAYSSGKRITICGSKGGEHIYLKNGLRGTRQKLYKPMPLSKKNKLRQEIDGIVWENVTIDLPKVLLRINKVQNKPVNSYACKYLDLLRENNLVIDSSWADFALTALNNKKFAPKLQEFTFELPYANGQKRVLLRRFVEKVVVKESVQKESPDTEIKKTISIPIDSNVDSVISDIVSDMISCVENHEIENKIIKTDPDLLYSSTDEKIPFMPPSPINSSVHAIIKRPAPRRNKTALELRRLNVQIIEVDMKESDTPSEGFCGNDFCRLGCVCTSLKGIALEQPHCGKVQCMLTSHCKCQVTQSKKSRTVTLPAGTDLLADGTMEKLQDEAVRHLAKEEKKFTQTVIKANNQTIVVGHATKERQKRVKKVPKKYDDYVHPTEDVLMPALGGEPTLQPVIPSEIKKEEVEDTKKPVSIWHNPARKSISEIKPKDPYDIYRKSQCSVKLEDVRNSLKNVEPLCMIHRLYKCHCSFTVPVIKTETKEIVKVPPALSSPLGEEFISYERRFFGKNQESIAKKEQVKKKESVEPKLQDTAIIKLPSPKNSRVTPVLARYQTRTRSKTLQEKDDELDSKSEKSVENDSPSLVTRTRAKKALKSLDSSTDSTLANEASDSKETVIAEGYLAEIREPNFELKMELMKLLGIQDKNSVIQLINWKTLAAGYKANYFYVWCNCKTKTASVLMTIKRLRPSPQLVDIKVFEQFTDLNVFSLPSIVICLTQNKIPGNPKNPENVNCILVKHADYWEIRATLETKAQAEKAGVSPKKPLPNLIPAPIQKQNVEAARRSEVPNGIGTVLILVGGKFNEKIPLVLPLGYWFRLTLDNYFAILKVFNRADVKYMQLIKSSEMAKKVKKVVRIRFDNNRFGIYSTPDRGTFVGPYNSSNAHGLQTLRYANGRLVDTAIYNKMCGVETKPLGAWYISTCDDSIIESVPKPELLPKAIIDLTDEPDPVSDNPMEEKAVKDTSQVSIENNSKDTPKNLNIKKVEAKVVVSPASDLEPIELPPLPKLTPMVKLPSLSPVENTRRIDNDRPTECIRYLVANIPGLGYVTVLVKQDGAHFQNFPITHVPSDFPTFADAVTWYLRFLTQRLHVFPKTFKLKYNILEKITSEKPLELKHVLGYYLACPAGLYDLTILSGFDMKQMCKNEGDIKLMFNFKVRAVVNKLFHCLANGIFPSSGIKNCTKYQILSAAPKKIKELETIGKKLETQKNVLVRKRKFLNYKLDHLKKILGENICSNILSREPTIQQPLPSRILQIRECTLSPVSIPSSEIEFDTKIIKNECDKAEENKPDESTNSDQRNKPKKIFSIQKGQLLVKDSSALIDKSSSENMNAIKLTQVNLKSTEKAPNKRLADCIPPGQSLLKNSNKKILSSAVSNNNEKEEVISLPPSTSDDKKSEVAENSPFKTFTSPHMTRRQSALAKAADTSNEASSSTVLPATEKLNENLNTERSASLMQRKSYLDLHVKRKTNFAAKTPDHAGKFSPHLTLTARKSSLNPQSLKKSNLSPSHFESPGSLKLKLPSAYRNPNVTYQMKDPSILARSIPGLEIRASSPLNAHLMGNISDKNSKVDTSKQPNLEITKSKVVVKRPNFNTFNKHQNALGQKPGNVLSIIAARKSADAQFLMQSKRADSLLAGRKPYWDPHSVKSNAIMKKLNNSKHFEKKIKEARQLIHKNFHEIGVRKSKSSTNMNFENQPEAANAANTNNVKNNAPDELCDKNIVIKNEKQEIEVIDEDKLEMLLEEENIGDIKRRLAMNNVTTVLESDESSSERRKSMLDRKRSHCDLMTTFTDNVRNGSEIGKEENKKIKLDSNAEDRSNSSSDLTAGSLKLKNKSLLMSQKNNSKSPHHPYKIYWENNKGGNLLQTTKTLISSSKPNVQFSQIKKLQNLVLVPFSEEQPK